MRREGAAVGSGVLAGYRRALARRDLRQLVLAFLVDEAASWAYSVVLTVYIFVHTHSVGWISAVLISAYLAGALASGPAGVVADRYDRRRVLICSALAATVVSGLVVAVIGSDGPVWLLLVLRVVLDVVCSPTRACSGALIPEVVSERDLVAANGLFGLLESLVVVLGPAIGGAITALGDPVYGAWVNTASFVVAAGLYASLAVRSRGEAAPGEPMLRQWVDGLGTLARHRAAVALVLFMLLDSLAVNAAGLLNAPLSAHVGGGASGIGWLVAACAIGGVLSAPLAARFSGSSRLSAVVYVAIVVQCVPLFLSYFAPDIAVAAALQMVAGAAMTVLDVLAFTALQRDLPRGVLGRALATVQGLLLATTVVGLLLTDLLYQAWGLGITLAVIAFGAPVVGLFGLPGLRVSDRQSASRLAAIHDRLALLQDLDLFDGATRATLEALATCAVPHDVAPGEVIIRQGAAADGLWIVESGSLDVSYVPPGADGQRPPVALPAVSAPGYVGELGLLNQSPRSATVTAATPCRLWRIDAADFADATRAAPLSSSAQTLARVRASRTGARARPEPVRG